MTGETISPLRQRMIEDMTVRSFDPRTQSGYIRAVRKLAAFLGRSPDEAGAEDLRRFQIHLRQTGVPAPTVNATISALRFFYRTTLDKPEIVRHLAVVPKAHRLPVVLSPDEVTRLLEAAAGPIRAGTALLLILKSIASYLGQAERSLLAPASTAETLKPLAISYWAPANNLFPQSERLITARANYRVAFQCCIERFQGNLCTTLSRFESGR